MEKALDIEDTDYNTSLRPIGLKRWYVANGMKREITWGL